MKKIIHRVCGLGIRLADHPPSAGHACEHHQLWFESNFEFLQVYFLETPRYFPCVQWQLDDVKCGKDGLNGWISMLSFHNSRCKRLVYKMKTMKSKNLFQKVKKIRRKAEFSWKDTLYELINYILISLAYCICILCKITVLCTIHTYYEMQKIVSKWKYKPVTTKDTKIAILHQIIVKNMILCSPK